MKVTGTLLALPVLGSAFPQLAGFESREAMLRQIKDLEERQDPNLLDQLETAAGDLGLGVVGSVKEKREPQGLLSGLLGPLLNDVAALTGALASSIDPNNKRPEPGYEFKAPKSTDSRGPCPGLNLLANHGYLPRDGHVTLAQVVEATARGFNMGADLSTILSVFAVLTDGDIATESWYLGTGPNGVGGLNRHSTVEADISPNREDYYNGCGDNHHLSSRMFRQNVACAAKSPDKDFGETTMTCQYAANAKFSTTNNPFTYFFPFPSIVSLGAFVFYPNFFSNGTYKEGGVANYESISSIIGAKLNKNTGEFEYVPERWPENWYRRSHPYGAVQTIADFLTYTYPAYPVGMPIAQLGTKNLNAKNILCDVVQGINSVTPLALSTPAEGIESAITWAVSKLLPVGLTGTILGCPKSALSPELYPNSSSKGGPLNPPAHVMKNVGNNVYNKVYHTSAPVTPQC